MDTLGTVQPRLSPGVLTDQWAEATQRLAYVAETGSCGLVIGDPGTGKSRLLAEMSSQLRRQGYSVVLLNLQGLAGDELAYQMASRIGLGISSITPPLELWSQLQDYAESRSRIRQRVVLLMDHLDGLSEAGTDPLIRLMQLFHCGVSWIFATRSWTEVSPILAQRSWLRIELQPLQRTAVAQVLSRDLMEANSTVRMTDEGMDTAQELSQGQIRRLKQLARLASLAAEADELPVINGEILRAVADEML